MSETTEEHNMKANLGYATTRDLLAEITARIEVDGMLDYSTVHGVPEQAPGEARLGRRVEDGGVMGTIIRCEECGGSGELHDPDDIPPLVEPDV